MFAKFRQNVDSSGSTKSGASLSRNHQSIQSINTTPRHTNAELAAQSKERIAPLQALKGYLHGRLLDNLNLSALDGASEAEIRAEIASIIDEALKTMEANLSSGDRTKLSEDLFDEVRGLGPLDSLLKDDTVSDILINGPYQIFVEKAGKLYASDANFIDGRHLLRIIDKIVSAVGRRVDESTPYVDARLADGSRFNAMVSPIALDGPLVSIRKFRRERLEVKELIKEETLSDAMAKYLQAAVSSRLNILISGGTGSGKTTLLNALSAYIDPKERILTIEDTAELQLQQPHVGRMESRPENIEGKGQVSQRDCLRNALRMRPDRIIIGETRGDEAIDMLQAMNTGHEGSMTTIHANSPRDGISRLENMVALSGVDMPIKALRTQIASALHIILQISRLSDGKRRITSIFEITGLEGETVSMQEIFMFQRNGQSPRGEISGHFTATGLRSYFSKRFHQFGYPLSANLFNPSPLEVN